MWEGVERDTSRSAEPVAGDQPDPISPPVRGLRGECPHCLHTLRALHAHLVAHVRVCTGVCRSLHGCVRESAWVCAGLHGHAQVRKGVCICAQECVCEECT
jgi:hypothetical protein